MMIGSSKSTAGIIGRMALVLWLGPELVNASCDPALLDTSTCNCSMCTGYMQGKCCKFSGIRGKIASLEDDPLWAPRINEWQSCTGAEIQMTFIDEDDMQAEMERDVGTTYYKGRGDGSLFTTSAAGIYDVYHIQPTFLPKTLPNIENLSPWIGEYNEHVKWSDVNPLSRKAVFFNSTVRALPLDTDYIAFGYREDLLDKYGKDKPETLDEMVELAEFMQGKDLDGDGEDGDFGMCTNANTWTLYSLVLPYMMTGTEFGRCVPPSSCLTIEENIFFNATSMEPFFETAAFRKALVLLRRLIIASNVWSDETHGCRKGDGWNCDRKKAFMTGRCAMFLSLPGTTTRMINGRNRPQHCASCTHPKSCQKGYLEDQYKKGCTDTNPAVWHPVDPRTNKTWYVRRTFVPGVTEVWDAKSNTLKPCTPALCPHARKHSRTGALINAGTYFPEGGESYAMRATADASVKRMMFEFLTRMSTLHLAETPLGGNYRKSQSKPEYIQSFVNEYGWDQVVVNDLYQEVIGTIFSDSWNTAQDLLMLGHDDYMGSLKDHIYKDYFGLKGGSGPLASRGTALPAAQQAALDDQLIQNLTVAWRRVTTQWGPLLQNERWRIALSLPQLAKDKLCELYTEDMNLRENGACLLHCDAGKFHDLACQGKDCCAPCPAGSYNPVAGKTASCTPCQPGYKCPEGSSEQDGCQPGTYSAAGASNCTSCPSGTHAPSPLTKEKCIPCSPGMHQPGVGEPFCLPCEVGWYQDMNGSSTCKPCKRTMTTSRGNSMKESDCGCALGQYRVKLNEANSICKNCGKAEETGITCPSFDTQPLVFQGFYMPPGSPRDQESLDVYKCMSTEDCPGQQILSDPVCGKDSHRTGINCGLCEDDYYEDGDKCERCGDSGGSYLLFPLSCFATWLFCGAIHWLWNHQATSHVEAAEGVLGSVTVGLTLGFIQSLGIFKRLAISWPKEFMGVLDLMSVFLLDLDLLRPSCLIPQGLAPAYILKLLVPIGFVLIFCSWRPCSLVLNKISKGKIMVFDWDGIANSLGMIILALYISFSASTLSLLECYGNPNGASTIRGYPYARCDSTEFYSMIPVFIIAVLLYVIAIFSFFCLAVYRAPHRYTDPNFRIRIRFLVFKFRPNKYWYAVVLMIRSFLLTMVAVLFPNDNFHQFIAMVTILVMGLFVHLVLSPYSDRFANNLESTELCTLLAIMCIGSWFMTERDFDSTDAHVYSVILMVLTFGVFFFVFGVFCWAMYLAQNPGKALQMHDLEVDNVLPRLKNICAIITGAPDDKFKRIVQNASYIDRWHVYSMASFFALELCGMQSTQMSQWRLPKVAKEVTIERKDTLDELADKALDDVVHVKSRTAVSLQQEKYGTADYESCTI